MIFRGTAVLRSLKNTWPVMTVQISGCSANPSIWGRGRLYLWISHRHWLVRGVTLLLLLFFIGLNHFQSRQYRFSLLHWDSSQRLPAWVFGVARPGLKDINICSLPPMRRRPAGGKGSIPDTTGLFRLWQTARGRLIPRQRKKTGQWDPGHRVTGAAVGEDMKKALLLI